MRWPIAQSTKAHDGIYICRFIGSKTMKNFIPKWILTDFSKEFVPKDAWAYLLDNNVQLVTTTPYIPKPMVVWNNKRRPTLGA